jgi:RNA polymerase sigma-70 factor (ECF subfamily)
MAGAREVSGLSEAGREPGLVSYAAASAMAGAGMDEADAQMRGDLPLSRHDDDAELDDLAAKTAGGDKAAFEAIYTRTTDDLYRYVRALCGNDTSAEDIVANTYLRAWRSARTYRDGSGSYRKWLIRIARNQVADHWRSNRSTVPIWDIDIASPDDSADTLAADEIRREVARLLATLTGEQREVVILRYLNNKSFEEISQLLGKREGAVRAQLMRALRHMRKAMK